MPATRNPLLAKLFRGPTKTFRHPTRLGLDVLEGREMPAVTALLSGGVLTVTGTTGNDIIPVVQSGATITAAGKSFATSGVNSVVVNGLDGNDIITISSTKPSTINGGNGNDTLTATSGTDRLVGGAGVNSYAGSAASDTIVDPVLTGGRAMSKAIMDKYQALGGSAGALGLPTADETAAPQNGRVVVFQNGYRIYWSAATGAHEVHGAIRVKYDATASLTDAYGRRVLDVLGLPTSDEVTISNGVWVGHFQGGDIYAITGTGVFAVYGAIKDKYNATAGLTDAYGKRVRDILGLPTSDEQSTPNNGRVTHFQGGDIYANLGVGAYVVYGAIRVKYNALGGPGGKVGLPTTDELAVPGGRVGRFQGADLYALPGVGVYEVNGAIRAKYNALGGPSGVLGLPITDEVTVTGGWYNHFQHGSIFANPALGAFEVHGLIRDRWASLNWQNGLLGFPTSDEFTGVDGWEVSTFQNGNIYWRAGAGAANGVHLGFDHNQTIGALKKSEVDGVLDGGEFNFFHAVAVDPQIFVDAPTRNLLHKLIDGDPANATSRVGWPGDIFGGFPVGNLTPGAPAWKVNILEQKWFEGLDRPFTGATDGKTMYAYAKVEGDLFGSYGPRVGDVDQGADGDCYFMASLAAVALKHPDVIRSMFTDNKDGTFTVRFYHNGQPEYVTVDRQVPVTAGGNLVYAGNSRGATVPAGRSTADFPVWAILAEKAYAQLNQSGWIGQDGTNSYNGSPGSNNGGINGGWASDALSQITGWVTSTHTDSVAHYTQAAFQAGQTVLVSTYSNVNVGELVGNHQYVLLKADATGVVVANPWGQDNLGGAYVTYLTWAQFGRNFNRVDSV